MISQESLRGWLVIGFGLVWLLMTVLNARIALLMFVRKKEHQQSFFVFLGGIAAFFAYRVAPLETVLKWKLFLLAVILDFGSVPYLIISLPALISSYRENAKEEEKKE